MLKSYLYNCGNSRANTCNKAPTLAGKSVFVSPDQRGRRKAAATRSVSGQLCADRTASRRRRIFQVSALSTVDGTCYAYHGDNG
ncbi:hypothetical protein DPMN_122659 [Dreissena polymorpha]|uniref:Uncharacterized protein n=1 Tax=Dreissena polymorpha TaxID=45954 RepID=A0A9D4JQK4_DREPO|nr:hypothetical protein DPMN_122659 [Dreissena polymorpha]